jgi:hypothetical protein
VRWQPEPTCLGGYGRDTAPRLPGRAAVRPFF